MAISSRAIRQVCCNCWGALFHCVRLSTDHLHGGHGRVAEARITGNFQADTFALATKAFRARLATPE